MSRIIKLASFVLLFTFFSRCGTANSAAETMKQAAEAAEDALSQIGGIEEYFPIAADTRYVYEGQGNEFASYEVYTEYAAGSRIQQRIVSPGTSSVRVIEITDGKAAVVFTREETYHRENFLNCTGGDEEILLKEPLKKGTSWTLKDGRVRTITDTAADVTTPSDNYKAIEVVTEGQGGKAVQYYAKNIGLVKSVFGEGEDRITSSLSKIEKDVPLVRKVRFFISRHQVRCL